MLAKIRAIICRYADLRPEEITMDSDIRSMGLTSFDVMNIVAECELEFKVVILERDIRTILTVGDLIRYIENA